jgi:hypothetical protein
LFAVDQKKMVKANAKSYAITGLDRLLGLQKVEAPRMSRQMAHEADKVVSPMHWLPLSPRRYLWYLFLLEAEFTPEP